MKSYKLFLALACVGLLSGCLDDAGLPEGIVNGGSPVITGDSIGTTKANSMEVFAVVSRHRGAPTTQYGFYVSREDGSEKTERAASPAQTQDGETAFSALITDLLPGTRYTIKAFARNRLGEGVGAELKKQTTNGLGSIATLTPDNVKGTSATLGGHILEPGEGEVLSRGVFRSRLADLSVKDTLVSPLSLDSFAFNVTGLDTMATYYVQAFVRNDYGYFTGQTESFTTKNGKPEFESFSVLGWQFNDASYTATLLSEGDAALTSKGVCWSESPNPTTADHVSINTTADFTGTITGLTPFTKYYVRAFATNTPFGTTYSEAREFTTRNDQPVVESTLIFDISGGSVGVEGDVKSAGMGTITAAGYCWSIYPDPTVLNNYKTISTSEGPFRDYIVGLRGGVTYYARAFAQNSSGQIAYGQELTFETPPIFTLMALFPGDPLIANSPASFVIGNVAYLVGGDKGLACANEFWSYNASDRWDQLLPFPSTARKWQAAAVANDIAYVFGGLDASNNRTNEMHRYLPSQNRWELVPTLNTPHPLHSAAATGVGSQLYFVGGSRDSILDEVWAFTPSLDTWEAKTALPEKQYGGMAVAVNNVLYAGLGLTNAAGTVSHKRLWSLHSGAWVEETSLPASAGHVRGSVVYNGAIYLVDHAGVIWKYDVTQKQWTEKSRLPSSNVGDAQHSMFVLNNMIYIGLGVSKKSLLKYDPAWDN
jgi:hypothetical protein